MTNDQTEALARMVSDAVHTAMKGASAEEIYEEVHGSLTAAGWRPPVDPQSEKSRDADTLAGIMEPYLETHLFKDANIPEVNRLYWELQEEILANGFTVPEKDNDWEYLLLGEGYRRSTEDLWRAKEWIASGGEVLRRRPLRSAGVWLNVEAGSFE